MTMDTARAAPALPETPIFSAVLTPHRSLSRDGLRMVMGIAVVMSLISVIPFLLLGAWPVGGFLGLDLLLLYICFRINNAAARGSEQVVLSRVELLVRKIGWRGSMEEARFNPFWVRLKAEDDPDYGMQRLALVQRQQEVEIGSFLAPVERSDFARAFGRALAEARR